MISLNVEESSATNKAHSRDAGIFRRPEIGMFICDVSDDGYKTFSHWASFKGQIWRENVLENGTEALIGVFHERNLVRL